MYYAGIGSRETPAHILGVMERLGAALASHGYTLRSGAADGADAAFERGCDREGGKKEIYLPWRRFNGHTSLLNSPSEEALEMAAEFHPAWERCSQGARKLHARNCHQILGPDLATPVNFVLCWTRNGSGTGGTGQAIRLARAHDIKVCDMGHQSVLEQVLARLESATRPM